MEVPLWTSLLLYKISLLLPNLETVLLLPLLFSQSHQPLSLLIMECGGSAAGAGAGGGDGFHTYRRQQPKPTSALNMLLTTNKPSSANNTPSSNHHPNSRNTAANSSATGPVPVAITNNEQSQQCVVREQDQYMPIANVIRIMRRILPSHAKISDDAKETIQECVSEYISFITGEANERCQREQRKTVTAEDVLWAMGKLGFDDYIEPLTVFLNRYRESESDRIRMEPIMRRNVDYGPQVGMIPPYGQAFQIGHVPAGMFDAMGGYYGGGGNGGSSSGNGSQL